MIASTQESLLSVITSHRVIIASAVAGAVILLTAWAIANSAASPPDPAPPAIWYKGTDGALVAFTYGIIPLVAPLIPTAIGYDAIRRSRETGFVETAMTRPVARWEIAIGMFLGTYLAVALPLLAVSIAAVFLISSIVGSSFSLSLATVFLGSVLILGALYLALVFMLGALLTPSSVSTLTVLLWFGFNLASGTALTITGRYLGLLLIQQPLSFQIMWLDLASFTGIYQALMVSSVPEALGFVALPDSSGGSFPVPYWLVPVMGAVWLAGLLVIYVLLISRHPTR